MNQDIEKISCEALTIRDQALAIVIKDKESYENAGRLLIAVKALRKQITEVFKPMKQAQDAAKKVILDQEKKANADAEATEKIIVPLMVAYDEQYGAPKIEGLRAPQDIWKYDILNIEVIPDEFWKLDEVKLGEFVRAMKEKTNVPGIQAYRERGGVRIEEKKQIEF